MSESLQQPAADAPPAAANGADTIETRARRMGWKDRHEFPNGAPDNWKDAATFLEEGQNVLPLLRTQMGRLERENANLRREQLAMSNTVQTMNGMMQRADERAMAKARRELAAAKDKAIETGDKDAVRVIDAELADLDKPPTSGRPNGATPPAVVAPTTPPEVAAWIEENPWFATDRDLHEFADTIHTGLLNQHRDWTLTQNLEETKRRVMKAFPEKFGTRRRSAADVSASGQEPPPQRSNGRGFADIPGESKAAYERYVKMLAGKGKPLTKDEWAADYWSQFVEI